VTGASRRRSNHYRLHSAQTDRIAFSETRNYKVVEGEVQPGDTDTAAAAAAAAAEATHRRHPVVNMTAG